MSKRLFDIVFSLAALIVSAPILLLAALAAWVQDGRSPLFRGLRVGRGSRDFRMLKLRSMTAGSEFQGAASTSRTDERITRVGALLRRWKLDELPQFWNVLVGDMSVVGPRPNTRRGGVDHYSVPERRLLDVRPGVTDLASIVFADEADILEGAIDPDARYNLLIRPWKSRLGLLYIERRDLITDLRIVWLTALAAVSRPAALAGVASILVAWDAEKDLRDICLRATPLAPVEPSVEAA